MTDERIAQIERAIEELEAAGQPWTNQAVYAKVGGRYGDLSAYLKMRRARDAGGDVAVADEPTEASLAEQYRAAVAARDAAARRVQALEALALVQLLSESEELEVLRLERRIANLGPIIARIERALEAEIQLAALATVQAEWPALMQQKEAAYAHLAATLQALNDAVMGVQLVHTQQEVLLATLPRSVQEKISFPDGTTMIQRVAGRMPHSTGWGLIMGRQIGLSRGEYRALVDADPGCKPLPARVFQHYVEGKVA